MKGSSLIEWLRWNALQPKVTQKNSTKNPLKSIAQNLTFKIPPHQIHHFARASSNPAVFGGYQVSWRKMNNSPGNRTWKLWCLQILKMKIHHLELQNNKMLQGKWNRNIFHRTWDEKVIVFFACSVFYLAFVHKKTYEENPPKELGGNLESSGSDSSHFPQTPG